MKSLEEVFSEIKRVADLSDKIVKSTGFREFESIIEIEQTADHFLKNELENVLRNLEDVVHSVEYLTGKILYEGRLKKNRFGRYEIEGEELTSGQKIEYFSYDEFEDLLRWRSSNIGYSHIKRDYIVYGNENLDLENLKVRIRGK